MVRCSDFGIFVEDSNEFNKIFVPFAKKLQKSLSDIGLVCEFQPKLDTFLGTKIIFGAHSEPEKWTNNLSPSDIMVNLEPVFKNDWRNKNCLYCDLLKRHQVLDYTKKNKVYAGKHDVITIPPLFRCHTQQEKDRLVLFVGNLTTYRRQVIQSFHKYQISVHFGFRLFGQKLASEINRAAIFLNINDENNDTFNAFRFALCSGLNTLFVGDSGDWSSTKEIEPAIGVSIVENPQMISELVSALINDPSYYLEALNLQKQIANDQNKKFIEFVWEYFGKR